MFRDLKEYHEIAKIYADKVSKPENLDEKIDFGSSFNTTKIIKNSSDKSKTDNKTSTTPPPNTKTITKTPMSTSGAQITTNQRQSKELAAKNKDVKLNKFNRTQTYGADAKGVKLVPGAKIGQKVDRSTVQTKAAFDFKGIKKGERLGVLTRNQRRKYDLMAAQKNKKTEVKVDPPKETTTTPTPPAPTENKGKLKGGQGGRPLGDTTRRQGGTVKSGVTLFKKGEDAKKFTDKTGFASKVDTVKGKDPKPKRPMGRDAAKRRSNDTSSLNVSSTKKNTLILNKDKETAKKTAMEEFTPYDIVLEYLLSSKQAATIEEANYIMTEMDAETIQSIVSD